MNAPNAGKTWTPEDTAYLERNYGRRTAHQIAQRLGRTTQGVRWKASKLHLHGVMEPPTNRVTLAEAEEITGLTQTAIRNRATKDKVLRRTGRKRDGKSIINTVPRSWAHALAATLQDAHRREYDAAGWLDLDQTATYTGLSRSAVYRAIHNQAAASRFFAGARTITVRSDGNDAILIHPQDVETARDRINAELHASSRMVTIRTIATALAITPQAAFQRAREASITPRKLLTERRSLESHVTPDEAAILARTERRAA